jgi:hypothetical protein
LRNFTNETEISYNLKNVTVLQLLDHMCAKAGLVWRIDPKCVVVGSRTEVLATPSRPPAKVVRHQDGHPWRSIEYPSLSCSWGSDRKMNPLIRSEAYGSMHQPPEFCVHLFMGLNRKEQRFPKEGVDLKTEDKENPWVGTLPKPGQIVARMYRADGTVVDTKNKNPTMGGMGGRWGSVYGSVECHFPWGTNDLGDAWILLGFPEERYWLAVPYGFARPIAAKLCAPEGQLEGPKPHPNIAKARADAEVVTWSSVEYNLKDIGNDWELSVIFTNSQPAICSLILYTERYSERGGWSLDSPSVALRIMQPDGSDLQGRSISSTKPDCYRRQEVFMLPPESSPAGRFWGIMAIQIDDVEHQIPVPSSLFKPAHALSPSNAEMQDRRKINSQPGKEKAQPTSAGDVLKAVPEK